MCNPITWSNKGNAMITNVTTNNSLVRTCDLVEVVRRIDEYVSILSIEGAVSTPEKILILSDLRQDVQTANRMMDRLHKTGTDYSLESMSITLDAALMVLNAHGCYGTVSQVVYNPS